MVYTKKARYAVRSEIILGTQTLEHEPWNTNDIVGENPMRISVLEGKVGNALEHIGAKGGEGIEELCVRRFSHW